MLRQFKNLSVLIGLMGLLACTPEMKLGGHFPDYTPPKNAPAPPPLSDDELKNIRWGKEVVPVFGMNRKVSPSLEKIPTRPKGQPRFDAMTRPESPQIFLDHMASCGSNYSKEWKGTQVILNSLLSSAQCWTDEQKKELADLQKKVASNIGELRRKIEPSQVAQAKSKKAELEKHNEDVQPILVQLGRDYQEVQEYLSYCRLNDVTSALPHIQPVAPDADEKPTSDDKAILHVLGDVFGKESGLEGQTWQESHDLLENRLRVFRTILKQVETKKYITSAQQAEPCAGILGGYHPEEDKHASPMVDFEPADLKDIIDHGEVAIQLSKAFGTSLEVFSKEFLSKLENLKKSGDWLYFMGGSIGHAVLYQVLKENENSYQFRVYNSGDGLSFHGALLEGSSQRSFPYYELRSVSSDKLTRLAFLKALRDLALESEGGNANSKFAFFYNYIGQELGGVITTPSAQAEDFLDPQIAGTCSYYVLPYMQTDLFRDEKLGSHLEFFVKSRLLDEYFNLNSLRINKVSHVNQLASQSLTFYSEEVAKNLSVDPGRQGRYLDWGMALETQNRMTKYRNYLDQATQAKEKSRLAETPQFKSSDLKNLPKPFLPPSSFGNLKFIKAFFSSRSTLEALDLENWKPHADTVTADLSRFLKQMNPSSKSLSSDDQDREVQRNLEGIQEIVKRIPLDQDMLKRLKPDQLTELLGHLNDLSQIHLWALIKYNLISTPNRMRGNPPTSILAQLKLLTLADQIIHLPLKPKVENFPSLYNPLLKHLILDKAGKDYWTSFLTIQDHAWTESFKEMSNYWQKESDLSHLESIIFQWERYPFYIIAKQNAEYYTYQRRIFKSSNNMNDNHWSRQFGNPDFHQIAWADIKWAHQYVDQSSTPALKLTSAIEALDYKKKVLPDSFFEVRDISFLTHYVLTGSFDKAILEKISNWGSSYYFSQNHENRISRPISFQYLEEPPLLPNDPPWKAWSSYRTTHRMFGENFAFSNEDILKSPTARLHSIYGPGAYVGDPNYSLEVSGARAELGPWSKIIESRNQFSYYVPQANLNIGIPFFKRLSSADILSQQQIKHQVPLKRNSTQTKEVSIAHLELQRQLLNLGSPLVTLAHFRENPDLLREKKWQILFKSLIFQPELLKKEFVKTPTLPKLLSDFCWLNFESRFKDEDYSASSFFLRMHQILEEFTLHVGKKPWPENRIARQGLRQILSHLPKVSDPTNLIYRDIIRTYRYQKFEDRSFTWQEAALLIEAVIYRDRNPLASDENFEAEEENAVFGLYQHKQEALKKYIKSLANDSRNSLMNHVVQNFRSTDQDRIWQESNYVSSASKDTWLGNDPNAKGDSISIDLTRPLILTRGGEDKPIPGEILTHPTFKKMVRWNEKEPYVTWLGDQRYEFRDLDGRLVRVDARPHVWEYNGSTYNSTDRTSTDIKIQKRFGTGWYQLLADAFVNDNALDEASQGKNSNWGYVPGYYNWEKIPSSSDQSSSHSEVNAYEKQANIDWREWDSYSSESEVLAFNPKDGKLFSVTRHRNWNLPVVQKVRHEGNKAFIYGTTLNWVKMNDQNTGEKNSLKFISRVELPRMIWVWQDHQNHLEKIDLPRFGVSFHPENGKLVSPELESYALSETQIIPNQSEKMGDYSHYLVLEKEGKVRIAVPRFNIINPKGSLIKGLFVKYDLDWYSRSYEEFQKRPEVIHSYGRNSQRLFVWSIDSFDHQLKLSNDEDRFYLALIHLWGRSTEYDAYERARELIYGSRSNLSDFRHENPSLVKVGAREILEWIFSIENRDHDPRALSLRLGTGFIVIENDFSFHRYQSEKLPGGREFNTSEFYFEANNKNVPDDGDRNKKLNKKIFGDTLNALYTEYLKTRDRISTRWVPEDLEVLYLSTKRAYSAEKNGGEWTDFDEGRWAELRGEKIQSKLVTNPKSLGVGSSLAGYYDLDPGSVSQYFTYCSQNKNVFLGINASFSELYWISLNADSINSVRSRLLTQLVSILQVSENTLNSYSDARLKEEYLTALKMIIRQGAETSNDQEKSNMNYWCKHAADFLYRLAESRGDRSVLKSYSSWNGYLQEYNKVKNEWNSSKQRDSDYDAKRNAYNRIRSEINKPQLDRVASVVQNESINQKVSTHTQVARAPRFWDPRTDSVPSRFSYQYDRTQGQQGQEDAKYDLHEEPVIAPKDLSAYVLERELNGAEKDEVSKVAKELKNIFHMDPLEFTHSDEDTRDAFIKNKLNETIQAIESKEQIDLNGQDPHDKSSKKYTKPTKKVYEWAHADQKVARQGLQSYRSKLVQLSSTVLDATQKLKARVEADIRVLPENAWAKMKEQVFREAAVEVRPDLKMILQAYATESFEKPFILNPGTSTDKVQTLMQNVTSYLIRATYHFKVEETIRALDQAVHKDSGVEELQRFYQVATSLRSYDIALHPDYLVFEYMMRMMIRSDQVENLERLTGEKTTLLEMIMGAGKTSVLLPLASRKNAVAGQKLSIVILPEALVPSMVKQLSAQLDQVFGRGVDRITISRNDKYDVSKLQYLYARLRKDLDTERVVVTSNSSIQSLFLLFIEALHGYSTAGGEKERILNQKINAFQDIFILLRHYGYVLIDEVDSILDIMASHRFSLGPKKRLEDTIVNASTGLYRILSESHDVQSKIKIPFIQNTSQGAKPFSREAYEALVKDRLIETVCTPKVASYFFEQEDQVRHYQSLDMEGLKKYFRSNSLEETQQYIQSIPSESLKDVITVLYTQIHQTLPMTLEKAYLVHYGLCPEELVASTEGGVAACHPFIGIPYRSGSPVVSSRFGTDLESLNYTIQSHLEHRNVLGMFKLDIENLKKDFVKNRGPMIRDQFTRYFGKELSDGMILNLGHEEIVAQAKIVSTQPELILNLVKKYAAPRIEIYPDQLFTNSHVYPILFKKIQGMTGTLWNAKSFPKFYQEKIPSDSLARTLTALWRVSSTRNVAVIDTPPPGQEVPKTLSAMLQGRGAPSIIDQGGIFRGQDNRAVTESMFTLQRGGEKSYAESGVPQLIYYDENHQIEIMRDNQATRNVRPYVVHEVNRMETGAFWDMQHTTGSDLKVHPKTVAILTLNKFSIMRDLLQAAWRLRELELAQSVIIMVTRDDLQIMSKILVEVYGETYAIPPNVTTVPLEKVLLYLATHEAIKSGEINYRSVKGSQKAVIVDSVFDSLLDRSAERDDLVRGFNHVKSFFSSPRGEKPFLRYGIPVVKVGTFEFLMQGVDRALQSVKAVFPKKAEIKTQYAGDKDKIAATTTWEKLGKIFKNDLGKKQKRMRRYVVTPLTQEVDAQEEMEIETENEVETEVENEVETKVKFHDIDENYTKAPIRWNREKFFKGELLDRLTQKDQVSRGRLTPAEIDELSPIISLKDIFEVGKPSLLAYIDLFDPRIFGSLNLFPVFQSTHLDHDLKFEPFGAYQGLIDHLLVILNEKDLGVHSLVLITRDESLETIGEWLHEDSESHGGYSKGRPALIYQIGNGIIRASGNLQSPTDKNLTDIFQRIESDPDFQTLLVQAMFLSGRINYTDSRRKALEHWVKRTGKTHDLFEFFNTHILELRDDTKAAFPNSVLYEVLKGK
jgi:hypothetical protein